jgi:hypothetical protein
VWGGRLVQQKAAGERLTGYLMDNLASFGFVAAWNTIAEDAVGK